jgi:hypothetical protein
VGSGWVDRNAGARVGGGWMTGGDRGRWVWAFLWMGGRRCGQVLGRLEDDKSKFDKKMTSS